MKRVIESNRRRVRRKLHIRKKLVGTPERPRMTVYKSNKYMYVQVIDDKAGNTLVSANNLEKDNRNLKTVVADAEKLGQIVGERCKAQKIESVVFDRNGFKYHGVVKAIADGARKAGINF